MRILLVEDDTMIGDAMAFALRNAHYAVDWVNDGQLAITAAQTQHYDAILLDLGLPKSDGFEVLRTIRNAGNVTPVLIVSARDAVESRIAGLDLGADDYVLKPFEIGELLARIRAVIRRKSGHSNSLLENGCISLNLVTREATVEGLPVRLSAREYSLLEALLIRPGAILSRQDLEDRLYQWDKEVESNAIEFLIHGLRKKLGPQAIKNVRGLGWMVSKQN
ncbi:response regulator [Solimicrobium silvestre]|uniref:Response regulators consisting of a CheY-like receiver domain and a winged-helix DNA-binding domain n=1 Tax=Solimicrobium silvestre TaxID=2099400 RepID=A0A2S9GZQ9_9BURK|nr:response regulator transcription factor [Solimicrobium silvestre]PRC93222.1 Response regulators consisting of a CheY-like receiver domain and a winged-helix DNA-binding domain [Solimicrobium silvestre]